MDHFNAKEISATAMSGSVKKDAATALIVPGHSRPPPVSTGLYHIPQELRDHIFHELWDLEPVMCLKQKSTFDICVSIKLSYGPRTMSQTYRRLGLPKWLLTNKSFLNDGLRQFYRHGIWEWFGNESRYDPRLSYSNPLAGMSAATNFAVLDHAFLHNRRARTDPALEPLQRSCHPAELITPLLSSKLQVLDLNLRIQIHHRDTYTLNLSRFGSTNLRLAKLSVCLRLKLSALSASVHDDDIAYAAFLVHAESEVIEMGRAWAGEKSTMQLEETISWFSDTHTRHEKVYVRGDPAKNSRRHQMKFTVIRVGD